MNRREFFRRTVPAVAVTVASVQSGWGLDFFRRLLAKVLRRVDASSAHTVSALAALYSKCNRDLLAALRFVTEEARWFASFPTEGIEAGSGVENRIPLVLA